MATNIEKKVTKAIKFGMIAEYFDRNPDMVVGTASVKSGKDMVDVTVTAGMLADAMRHEVELLANSKKPTPKQTAEKEIRRSRADMIADFLRDHSGEKFTISELQRTVPGLPADISTSAVTYLFTMPVLAEHSKRTIFKGRAYYQYVE